MAPGMMHAAGFAGLDFIRIDAEHMFARDERMEFVLQTALAAGVTAIVRVDGYLHQTCGVRVPRQGSLGF